MLISFSLFWKYTFHFEIFAVIIAFVGALAFYRYEPGESEKIPKWLHISLFVFGVFLIFILRVIPYFGNTIPLGYDAGIYKYGIENFAAEGFGADKWVLGAMSPGLLYLTLPLLKAGISSEFLLIWGFVFFGLLLGFSIYLAAREYFGDRTAIIALLLFAVSSIQFKVFTYMYYKNVIALACLFFALYFLERSTKLKVVGNKTHLNWNRFFFILFGVLVGIMHLPTFFIFGLAYLLFTVNNWKSFGRKFIDGFLIFVISLLFYAGFWEQAILPLIAPVAESFVEPGSAPGTFVSFFVYQFSTLYILPFAIFGFLSMFWRRKFNLLFFLTMVVAVIVYFQFFFFNRFIIHLDVFLIVLAASAFSFMISNSRRLGVGILVLMVVSSGWVTFNDSIRAEPLITSQALELIKRIGDVTEKNAQVIAISSEYSPWVLAYSGRETIAPGLFEANKWSRQEWEKFWNNGGEKDTKELMNVYGDKPTYLFIGTKRFNNPCFEEFLSVGSNKLLRYTCG